MIMRFVTAGTEQNMLVAFKRKQRASSTWGLGARRGLQGGSLDAHHEIRVSNNSAKYLTIRQMIKAKLYSK